MKEYICIEKEHYVRLLKVFNELEEIIKEFRATHKKQKMTLINIDEAKKQ